LQDALAVAQHRRRAARHRWRTLIRRSRNRGASRDRLRDGFLDENGCSVIVSRVSSKREKSSSPR